MLYEQRRGNVYVLRPQGRLDSVAAEEFRGEIDLRLKSGAADIVVDLENIDYISSAGLRVLLVSAKSLNAKSGTLSLCALNDHVREVFEVSGFVTIFSIFDSVDEACDAAPKE